MKKRSPLWANYLLGLLLALAIPFLFTAEGGNESYRLVPYIWNIGHILLFFTGVWLALNLLEPPGSVRFLALFVLINLVVLTLGFGIEGVQSLLGRQSSWEDMYKNCLGASLAIVFHPRTPPASTMLKVPLQAILVMFLLIALYPLTINTIDWIQARSSFPILANFESPFEIERWRGDRMGIGKSGGGNHVLQNVFLTTAYSQVTLVHFPPDWKGYDCLEFNTRNPGDDAISLTVKISDTKHNETGREYIDRFNHRINITSGRHTVQIPIDKLRQAPQAREMDISQIAEIALFTTNLSVPATLMFDDFHLSNRPHCDVTGGTRLK